MGEQVTREAWEAHQAAKEVERAKRKIAMTGRYEEGGGTSTGRIRVARQQRVWEGEGQVDVERPRGQRVTLGLSISGGNEANKEWRSMKPSRTRCGSWRERE